MHPGTMQLGEILAIVGDQSPAMLGSEQEMLVIESALVPQTPCRCRLVSPAVQYLNQAKAHIMVGVETDHEASGGI
jgi:hypothetical protein